MRSRPTSHPTFGRLILAVAAATLLAMTVVGQAAATQPATQPATVGQTRVARWQDDRAGCFLLMFDDGWPSHWQVAAPELVKRGMTGTFYVCPDKGEYKAFAKKWEQELWKQGMVYGNHTMTHKGVKDLDDAEREIGDCTRAIKAMVPGRDPRLISYAQPGVPAGAWNITPAQLDALLAKHHLVTRGEIAGRMTVYHLQTAAEMLALADKAVEAKGVDFLVVHGIERIEPDWGYQDMWPMRQSVFLAVLDGLKARQDDGRLWITDHVSSHQYATERDAAAVKVLEATGDQVRLELTSTADPKLYDLPLTLVTRIPPTWRAAKVMQGERAATAGVRDGAVRFRAVPNGGPITLTPAEPGR